MASTVFYDNTKRAYDYAFFGDFISSDMSIDHGMILSKPSSSFRLIFGSLSYASCPSLWMIASQFSVIS